MMNCYGSGIGTVSDRWARFIFMLLGIGVLTPWNAFISAIPYFQSRVCSIPGASEHFELWLGLVFNSCSVLSLGLLLIGPWIRERLLTLGIGRLHANNATDLAIESSNQDNHHRAKSKGHSFWLVTVPLCCYLTVFIITGLLATVKNIKAPVFLFYTMLGIIVLGVAGAFCQAGIVTTCSFFPPQVGINAFVSGQAVGGVAVSAANFLSATAEDPQKFHKQHCASNITLAGTVVSLLRNSDTINESNGNNNNSTIITDDKCLPYDKIDTAVFLYFFVGAAVSLACVVGFAIIDQQVHRDAYEPVQGAVTANLEEFQDEPSLHSKGGLELSPSSPVDAPTQTEPTQLYLSEDDDEEVITPGDTADSLFRRLPSDIGTEEVQSVSFTDGSAGVLNAVKGPAFTIFFTFFVTLALFPSWTSRLRSVYQCRSSLRLLNDLFTPMTFLLFNVGDLVGRLLAERIPRATIQNLSTKLVLAACLRCIFFPMLLVCIGGTENNENRLQVHSDFYSVLIQSFFAISNGTLISLSFMHAPMLTSADEKVQQKSSEVLTFAVYFGLLSGSLFSFPLSAIAF